MPRLRLRLKDWRAHMCAARAVAVALAREGVLEIVQKGRVVPPTTTFKGPIRLRLAKRKGKGAGAGGKRESGGGGGGHG